MQRIQLVVVLAILTQDAVSSREQVIERLALGLRGLTHLSSNIAVNPSHPRAQGAQGCTHAPKLFGMGIAANLPRQSGRFAIVVLPQMQAALPCYFHQVSAAADLIRFEKFDDVDTECYCKLL